MRVPSVSPLRGKTTDWRAGCGRSARPVRREGEWHSPLSLPQSQAVAGHDSLATHFPALRNCRLDATKSRKAIFRVSWCPRKVNQPAVSRPAVAGTASLPSGERPRWLGGLPLPIALCSSRNREMGNPARLALDKVIYTVHTKTCTIPGARFPLEALACPRPSYRRCFGVTGC